MDCPICTRNTDRGRTICNGCARRLAVRLEELPLLHAEAHKFLEPQRRGQGGNVGESAPSINLNALDFVSGKAILDTLHGWERIIREDRHLTPPALVPKQPTVEAEVAATVKFHLVHLDWSVTQPFADDFAREVAEVHQQGMTAAQQFRDPVRRVACPTDTDDGGRCGYILGLAGTDLLQHITCKACGTNWTTARLVAVAVADAGSEIWLDVASIAQWVGLSESQAYRIAKKLPHRGKLVELHAFLNARRRVAA